MKTVTYHVAKWSAVFENTRSRRVEFLRWVPIPNTHDGEKYTRLISRKDGAIIFAAWILIVQVASRCEPRGSLVRSDSSPLDSEALAIKTRAPKAWFDSALPYLVEIGWLSSEVHEQAQLPLQGHSSDTQGVGQGQAGGQEWNGMEGNGKKGIEPAGAPAGVEFPFEFRNPEFTAAWTDWLAYRKQRKFHPYTEVGLKGTFARLLKMGGSSVAVLSIRESIAQNWQGLFEPKPGQVHQVEKVRVAALAEPGEGIPSR